MASSRTRRPAAASRPERTIYPGQKDEAGLLALVKERGELAAAKRLAWLKDHPEYIPCIVGGCSGLVGPAYQRLAPDGSKFGWCPRRQTHARLYPAVFSQPRPAA